MFGTSSHIITVGHGLNERMLLARFGRSQSFTYNITRCFSITARVLEKPLPPRRVVTDDEISEVFLKGSGPGGQKINKTSSAVQIKHLATGIVVKCQATRSREQNRKTARKILGEKLEDLEKGDQSRNAIKAERARTKKASASKKIRRKYRLLADEKAEKTQDGGEAAEDGSAADSALKDGNDAEKSESHGKS